MSCTWLKSRREERHFSQYALGKAVGVDEQIILRWENCEPGTSKHVLYAQLVAKLGESEVDLAEDHARDLTQAGLYEQAERARDAADKARRARTFAPIDPAPIRRSLETFQSTGLCDNVAPSPPTPGIWGAPRLGRSRPGSFSTRPTSPAGCQRGAPRRSFFLCHRAEPSANICLRNMPSSRRHP